MQSGVSEYDTEICYRTSLRYACWRSRFLKEKVLQCIREVNKLTADAVIITGGLTAGGLPEEFKRARSFVNRLQPEPIIIMGNHDARNVGHEAFEEYFGERIVIHEDDKIFLVGVNSSSQISMRDTSDASS